MGVAAGAASGASSLLSMGLSAGATVMEGMGKKAGADDQAARAERAAQFGKVNANLTDATMREELNTTLGNIDAIRAFGNIDPTSPTTQAFEDIQSKRSDRQRTAAVLGQRQQAADDEASAQYLRQAGNYALMQSYVGAGAKVFGGIAKAGIGG